MPLRVRRDVAGVAWVTIDHPPINLFDLSLLADVAAVGAELAADDSVLVVVVDSADPDFFIAHFDVETILSIPRDVPDGPGSELGGFHTVVDRFRTMPKLTIALVEGRARGGGAEWVSSFDLRVGVLGRTVLGQPEVPLGILPGGSGTQRLPRLVGRGHALEIILGGSDVDAETAERWGWLDRVFPTSEDARAFVERLAARVASWPPEAVRLAKQSVDNALPDPVPGMLQEEWLFRRLAARDDAREAMHRFLDQGGQTREVELDLDRAFWRS